VEQKSSFDSRSIMVIVLCMAFWFGWQHFYLDKKYPDATLPTADSTSSPEASKSNPTHERVLSQPSAHAPVVSDSEDRSAAQGPETFWNYEDGVWKITVSSLGGRVSQVELKKYTDRESKPIILVSNQEPGYLLDDVQVSGGVNPNFSKLNYKITSLSKEAVELTATSAGMTLKKTLTVVPDKYIIHDQTVVSGNTAAVRMVSTQISQPAPKEGQSTGSFLNRGAGVDIQEYFFSHGTKTNRHTVTFANSQDKNYDQTNFASLGSRYFTTLLFNRGNVFPAGESDRKEGYSQLVLKYPVLDSAAPIVLTFDAYAGPKLLNQLKAVDDQAAQVVDFGFFSWIALPLLELMKFFYHIFSNYGIAIIALTILVRGLTFPFTYLSFKSMKSMQRIQPELARLKEIHKNNTQVLHQETMKLMRDNKVNPAGGCLPLLLQLPIFWALYQVLQNSIELYHSPFVGWIHDLSLKDPYFVLPVLMCITMVIQQRLTPNTMDPAQAKIMMFMPVMFGFLMMSLPAGLTLYIFVSTLFGILQQLFMMRDRNAAPAVVRRA
jgi:YidC/Oxa1 family membrane protein insertase